MTIQRQYSLPNCTLVLEGLGDSLNPTEFRPLMTILINAECHFPGEAQPLSGGRDFFEGLINTVSQYGQEVLSGIHKFHGGHELPWVELKRLTRDRHRLSVRPPDAAPGTGIAAQLTREVDLSTVQLFDLVEAVDQFFADSQTLPDLTLKLTPVSRRYVRSSGELLAKQAVPATIGASSVAVAAAALFWLPAPQVRQPENLTGTTTAASTPQASPGASPSPGVSPSPTGSPTVSASPTTSPTPSPTTSPTETAQPDLTNLASVLNTAPEITDPAQLDTLGQNLRRQIDEAWKNRQVPQDLTYRLGVAKDGSIVGYKPVNPAALTNAKLTPLLDLLYRPATGSQPSGEPIAQFKVVFTPTGVVEVAPWRETMTTSQSAGTEITNTQELETLLPKLREQLIKAIPEGNPNFSQELVFRVRVKSDGTIADYRPENQPATDSVQNTPLPKISKLADTTTPQEPYALFKVVFQPNGRLEISPWRGWKD